MASHDIDSRLFLALLVFVCPASTQGIPRPEPVRRAASDRSTARVVFEGFVLQPGGAPAEGALVISSAGGRAVTDAAGSYRLEVDVPREATSAEVTAVGSAGGNLVASSSVTLNGTAGATLVDPLTLSAGSSCSPSWLPTFGAEPGMDATVSALTVYDDGGGPALYAGGSFTTAGGVAASRIARWDGSSWSALGSGMNSDVYALTVHDDGSGPALYAGGAFTTAGGVAASRIARWDGSSWSALGSGMDATVSALTVYDDGGGPALYAGGSFTTAGGVAASKVARWDGLSWSALGSGMNFSVSALAVHDDGGGPALYAGGAFTTAGGVAASRIARWDGTSWSALGSGLGNGHINALTVYDDGSGPALYAGGVFDSAGGVTARSIARWDGSGWSPLGGTFGIIYSLTVYDDGGGPALYAGGRFSSVGGVAASAIARWNGSSWSALGSGIGIGAEPQDVRALTGHDDGRGPALFAGGIFTTAGSAAASRIARWDGTSWSVLGSGMNATTFALTVYDDGNGPALYAGGSFTTAGDVAASKVARWDGTSWSALGSGMNLISTLQTLTVVHALTVHDDGGGPALYAGGDFTTAGGVAASQIARWDGTSWSALGSGVNGRVRALAVHDDGGGTALYAAGDFTTAGGVAASRIARWDGTSWSALGSGLNSFVNALTVHDDGGGPALYAAGEFTTAGGVAASRIARWDGTSWSALGSGLAGRAYALTVYDDGSGPALYVGGEFTAAGGSARHIARWDGTSWSALGSGMNLQVDALTVHDDGGGPALYAGGFFTTAGGLAASRIARWDGTSWSALGSGMNSGVYALAVHDDGGGPSLYAGGSFSRALDSGDSYVAQWGCLAAGCTSVLLDFETEDDLVTPLGNGQHIDTEFGHLVVISGAGANDGPATFDTTPGGPNDPALNDDMLIGHGNVLLLEDDWYGWSQTVPGFFDVVTDDPHGGDLIFDFTSPVEPRSVLLADINPAPNLGASVTLVDEGGRTRVYTVEPGWTGTYGDAGPHELDLTTLDSQPGNGTPGVATAAETPGFLQARVVRIVVHLTGYGALDELEFCR